MLKLAGMNQTDMFGKVPPIFPAALRGNYDICKFIIENVDHKNIAMPHNGSTPLHTAAKNGCYEICQLLILNVNEKNLQSMMEPHHCIWLHKMVTLKHANS